MSGRRPICFPPLGLQERTPGNYLQKCFQINRGSEAEDLALGHWNYNVWTKRKLVANQPTGRIPLKRMPQKGREHPGNKREPKGPNTVHGCEGGSGCVTSVKLPWKLVWRFTREAIINLKIHLRYIINYILDHAMLTKICSLLWGGGRVPLQLAEQWGPGGVNRVLCWMKMPTIIGKSRKGRQPFSSYPIHLPYVKGSHLPQIIASKIFPLPPNLFGQHALGFSSHPGY